jgi:hypothetical protein
MLKSPDNSMSQENKNEFVVKNVDELKDYLHMGLDQPDSYNKAKLAVEKVIQEKGGLTKGDLIAFGFYKEGEVPPPLDI